MATDKGSNSKVVQLMGTYRDLMSQFSQYRRDRLEADMAKATETLCCSMYTRSKHSALLKEMDRLKDGFTANAGFLKNLASEMYISDWQKSPNWVNPGNVNKCYYCKKIFTFLDSKNNCRIGGQVFCAKCIKKDGLLIYQDNRGEEAKWGINGKDNGQKKKHRFRTYPVCISCSGELEKILIEDIETSHQKSPFMDSVCEVQQKTLRMQAKVDRWLPEYRQAVKAVNLEIDEPKKTLQVAKLHLNLSNTLFTIKHVYENELMRFHLEPKASIKGREQKLLENVLMGTQLSYKEHLQQFHSTNEQLTREMYLLIENQLEVLKKMSRKSIIFVYINIRKLVTNLIEYTECYSLDGALLEDAKKIELTITEELEPLPERLSWEQQFEVTEENPSGIQITQMVMTSADPTNVKFVIASQSSTIIQQCFSKLKDETLDLEFQRTKMTLKQAWDKLELTLAQLNRSTCTHYIAF